MSDDAGRDAAFGVEDGKGPAADPWVPPAPPAPPPTAWHAPARGEGDGRETAAKIAVAATLAPVALVLFLVVAAPGFVAPLLDSRAATLGLPPLVVSLLALAAFPVLALGILRARGPVWLSVIVAFVGATVGMFLVILAPAIVLIMINLGGPSLDG